MLTIDSVYTLALSVEDICQMSADKINKPNDFLAFHQGVELTPTLLLSQRWAHIGDGVALSQWQAIDYVIMEMLPHFYKLECLEEQGGVLALSVTDVGDYTIYALNQRVVVLSGLPHCQTDIVTHIHIACDVFIAYLRGLLLDFSEDILADDDEDEDRPLSDTELQLYGMPAGGNVVVCAANTGKLDVCVAKAGACAANTTHLIACAAKAMACGADAPNVIACGADATACGGNTGGASACAARAMACGANVGTGNVCAVKAGACAAAATAATACAAKATACAARASAGTACGADTGSCASKATAGNACGARATACGAKIAAGGGCGAKAGACGVDIGNLCAANASACGINFPGDIVSACAINIIPLLPSC